MKPELTIVPGLALVRRELHDHGYSGDSVARLLGLDARVLPFDLLFLDRLSDRGSNALLHDLVRLFALGLSIPRAPFERAFSTGARETLVRSGILVVDERDVRTPFVIVPWLDFLLVCDREYAGLDTVNVPNDSSFAVAQLVAPVEGEPRETAIDLGTGCGVVALLASRYYGRSIAIDVNPRAVEFAAFNAALNAVSLDCRVGAEIGFRASPELDPEAGSADLVTFVMPFLYPELAPGVLPAWFATSRPGERLAELTYESLGRLLSPSGRGVLWHQVTTSDGDTERWFERVEPRRALSVEAQKFRVVPSLPYYSIRAHVRHATPERPHCKVVAGPGPTEPLTERGWPERIAAPPSRTSTPPPVEVVRVRRDDDAASVLASLSRGSAVIIVDAEGSGATDLVGEVLRTRPEQPVLASSSPERTSDALSLVRRGARGHVVTTANDEEVAAAARRIRDGDVVFSVELAELALTVFHPPEISLTTRELEVLRHLARGYSSQVIARRQQVPARSVETHMAAIWEKLKTARDER